MHPDWPRKLRDDCDAAGTPFFFKQWGSLKPLGPFYGDDDDPLDWSATCPYDLWTWRDGYPYQWHVGTPGTDGLHDGQPPADTYVFRRVGKKKAGRMLDGAVYDQMPNVE